MEPWRKRNDAFHTDAAKSWFEADDAAESSRNANGTTSVAPNAAVAEACGNGGSGAAAGAAWNARWIPRVVYGAVVRIVAGDAVGELVHVGFAENDRASFLELCDDRGVVLRNELGKNS